MMKRLSLILTLVAFVGAFALPVWAGSDRPAADQLIKDYYERQGEAAPQATYTYLVDLVTNASSGGWGSVFVLTNYSSMVRNHIQGYVVPKGVNPGSELVVDIWLNPYEVKYIDLNQLGLGNENGWSILWSTIQDFGCGVLIYNTDPNQAGILWEHPWYWVAN